MLTLKQGLKISAIVDKLDIKINDPGATQEAVGADLIMQVIRKAYMAENEIYAFVAEVKNITPKEAEKIDLIIFIKELLDDSGAMSFFKSAVS